MFSCQGNCREEEEIERPGMVVEKFYSLMQDHDYEQAARMYSRGGQTLTTEETKIFEEVVGWTASEYEKKDGLREVIIIEETLFGDNKTAHVKYNIVFNNGDEEDKKQSLEKVNGIWYLKMFNR